MGSAANRISRSHRRGVELEKNDENKIVPIFFFFSKKKRKTHHRLRSLLPKKPASLASVSKKKR